MEAIDSEMDAPNETTDNSYISGRSFFSGLTNFTMPFKRSEKNNNLDITPRNTLGIIQTPLSLGKRSSQFKSNEKKPEVVQEKAQ